MKKTTIKVEIKKMWNSNDKYFVEIFWQEGNKRFTCMGDHGTGMSLYEAQHTAYIMRDNILIDD